MAANFFNRRQTCVTEHSRTSTVWLLFVSNPVSQYSDFNKSRPLNNYINIFVYENLINYLFTVAEWCIVDRITRVTISNENWVILIRQLVIGCVKKKIAQRVLRNQ